MPEPALVGAIPIADAMPEPALAGAIPIADAPGSSSDPIPLAVAVDPVEEKMDSDEENRVDREESHGCQIPLETTMQNGWKISYRKAFPEREEVALAQARLARKFQRLATHRPIAEEYRRGFKSEEEMKAMSDKAAAVRRSARLQAKQSAECA